MEDPASLEEALAWMDSQMGGQTHSVPGQRLQGMKLGCRTALCWPPAACSAALTRHPARSAGLVFDTGDVRLAGTALSADKSSVAGSSYFSCRS